MPPVDAKGVSGRVPIADGLFTIPVSSSETPHLIGARCGDCGTVMFPAQDICPKCCGERTERVALSRRGKVYTSTILTMPPPDYEGPVPYAVGYVELPEGAMVPAVFAECSLDKPLAIGTEVEVALSTLTEDGQGNEVLTYAFRPVG